MTIVFNNTIVLLYQVFGNLYLRCERHHVLFSDPILNKIVNWKLSLTRGFSTKTPADSWSRSCSACPWSPRSPAQEPGWAKVRPKLKKCSHIAPPSHRSSWWPSPQRSLWWRWWWLWWWWRWCWWWWWLWWWWCWSHIILHGDHLLNAHVLLDGDHFCDTDLRLLLKDLLHRHHLLDVSHLEATQSVNMDTESVRLDWIGK